MLSVQSVYVRSCISCQALSQTKFPGGCQREKEDQCQINREKFDEEAYAFYTGQLLQNARKEAKVTQAELAKRINSTKSYISRVENGDIIPSVAKFWEMITSLGMRVEIVKPI